MSNITFQCLPFDSLTLRQLYAILALRIDVFVVEQNCPFQDADGKDLVAWHCLGVDDEGDLVAYTRLFDVGLSYEGYTSIGRVATSQKVRGQGVGQQLIAYSIEQCEKLYGLHPIKIGAQQYLLKFYESFGFRSTGEDYLEDGIPHTIMIREV
ncbi:MAG: GNAT family N-acetyltransferase [Spirosomataceae bacterium]